MTAAQPSIIIQLGETEDASASPSSKEPSHDQVPLIQNMFAQIVERNKNMQVNMEAQAESQIVPKQTRLLSSMELERSQFKIAFSHPTEMSVGSTSSLKTVNFTVDTHKLPMLDKINLHMQTGQLIVNDLHKTNVVVVKVEKMLNKVIQQLKLEKANSRALNTQVEELKNIIVNIGINPDDQPAVQELLKSAKAEIGVLKKKLHLPIG